jgi:hypothetical protein
MKRHLSALRCRSRCLALFKFTIRLAFALASKSGPLCARNVIGGEDLSYLGAILGTTHGYTKKHLIISDICALPFLREG